MRHRWSGYAKCPAASFQSVFLSMLDRFGSHPAAMKQAGIAYATEQIVSLIANGIQNIHIYSMNKPEVAEAIMNNLSEMIEHE